MMTLWSRTREELLRTLGPQIFHDYVEVLVPTEFDDGVLLLRTDDEMKALIIDKNYRDIIEQCASSEAGRPLAIRIEHAVARENEGEYDPARSIDSDQIRLFEQNEPVAALRVGPSFATRERSASSNVASSNPAPSPASAVQNDQTSTPSRAEGKTTSSQVREKLMSFRLSPALDFESFVVGSSNQFAHEAAHAVAKNPGTLYNPLLIFGGVGLGKTHLMNAIGTHFLWEHPQARVRYLSAETFVNELIAAIGSKRMDEFRQRNRIDVDLLLIDDIQFIAGKERTQEEFFHTFNALHQAGRQIVLTSDRFPNEMPELEERLKSRLGMGLVADIQPPELETRIAILQQRAIAQGFHVPQDVLEYIAEHIQANVRELHGALTRVGSWSRLQNAPITLEIAKDQLAPVLAEREYRISPDRILNVTCEVYSIRASEIMGRKRVARIAEPRKVAMYLAKKYTDASYPELGRFFGGRDHTTVLSGCRSIEKMLENHAELRARVDRIEKQLRQ